MDVIPSILESSGKRNRDFTLLKKVCLLMGMTMNDISMYVWKSNNLMVSNINVCVLHILRIRTGINNLLKSSEFDLNFPHYHAI